GAMRWRRGDRAQAREAFAQALRRVERHPLASIGWAAAGSDGLQPPTLGGSEDPQPRTIADVAIARAVALTLGGRRVEAGRLVDDALAASPPGNAAWVLPVEPLLAVEGPEWDAALARLRSRAA
ncbi:MAG TPA: hypothetical protein VNN99_07435, partial [Vicinamibacterales bacterium]|nr:hypothetical protein [Vicinamibacterales bacterium]